MSKDKKIYTVKDSYNSVEKQFGVKIEKEIYYSLLEDIEKVMTDRLLNGDEIALPFRIGTLSIKGAEQKIKFDNSGNIHGLIPDWKKTKELWANNPIEKEKKKIIYYLNEKTDGKYYYLNWDSKKCIFRHKKAYKFKVTSKFKKKISESINSGNIYPLKEMFYKEGKIWK